jgi:hypothetical protein
MCRAAPSFSTHHRWSLSVKRDATGIAVLSAGPLSAAVSATPQDGSADPCFANPADTQGTSQKEEDNK